MTWEYHFKKLKLYYVGQLYLGVGTRLLTRDICVAFCLVERIFLFKYRNTIKIMQISINIIFCHNFGSNYGISFIWNSKYRKMVRLPKYIDWDNIFECFVFVSLAKDAMFLCWLCLGRNKQIIMSCCQQKIYHALGGLYKQTTELKVISVYLVW